MSQDNKVVSLSGAPIYRYDEGEKPWQSAQGDSHVELISQHIERHIGPVAMVFHEILSDTVHIDIHHVTPTPKRPYHYLITSGMSDLPMAVPEHIDAPRYLELMMTLPADWQLSQADFEHEHWYWPIRQLKFLARFPHKFDTWLGWAHTIPNGDPPQPFADNTALSGMMLLPPLTLGADFQQLPIDANKNIEFFSLVPLYNEEMNFKLSKGSDALLDKFDQYQINEVLNISRKNVAKKRFGWF